MSIGFFRANLLEVEVRRCSSDIFGLCELLLLFMPYRLDELGIGLSVRTLSLQTIQYFNYFQVHKGENRLINLLRTLTE